MKKNNRVNRMINALWVLLIIFVLGLFLYPRLSHVSSLWKRLHRSPQLLKEGFKAKDMANFRCDFTRPEDPECWNKNHTQLQVMTSPLTLKKNWAKVTYYPAGTPGFLWTEDNMGMMDWRRARTFSFRVYNPQGWMVDLKVKIKDETGRIFQKSVKLKPGAERRIELSIQKIAETLDAGRINYFNLFLWKPSSETVLYYTDFSFDAVNLPPPNKTGLRFMGLEFPSSVRPGEEVKGAFYFIPHRGFTSDCRLLVRLEKNGKRYTLKEIEPPFPTSKWPVGKLVKVGPTPLIIPADIPEGDYQLEVILASSGGMKEQFEPYENAEIKGFRVSKIQVTAPPAR